jgi:hypothetical protein
MTEQDAAETAAVTAFWRALGLPGLIDVHTHFMPANVLAKIWAYFDGVQQGSGNGWPIAYRLLLDAVWSVLAEAGVPAVVHCGSGPMPGAFTGPGPISAVLARHPRLVLIIPYPYLSSLRRWPGSTWAMPGFAVSATSIQRACSDCERVRGSPADDGSGKSRGDRRQPQDVLWPT